VGSAIAQARRHARRGKGHQRRAGAEGARRAGRRDRARGRVHGTRIVEQLTSEAISTTSSTSKRVATSTAVVDPTGGTYTEINEWGPAVRAEELDILLEKLRYLTQGAELVIFAGRPQKTAADVDADFYGRGDT